MLCRKGVELRDHLKLSHKCMGTRKMCLVLVLRLLGRYFPSRSNIIRDAKLENFV